MNSWLPIRMYHKKSLRGNLNEELQKCKQSKQIRYIETKAAQKGSYTMNKNRLQTSYEELWRTKRRKLSIELGKL